MKFINTRMEIIRMWNYTTGICYRIIAKIVRLMRTFRMRMYALAMRLEDTIGDYGLEGEPRYRGTHGSP
jgi:hypothetical protein